MRNVRSFAAAAVAVIATMAWVSIASAAGAVNIAACQTLSTPNTVYKLTTPLTSCGDCLIVAADKVTIDLQGNSITGTCPGTGAAITDNATSFDLITVKNGSGGGFGFGVFLQSSTRVSVLGFIAAGNTERGIVVGPKGLVKSCEAAGNKVGIEVGPRGQVQLSNAHDNNFAGIDTVDGDHCLITMNIANANGVFGIVTDGDKCTVSFNTASNNGHIGIDAGASLGGTGHLVTENTAFNNVDVDYAINCPPGDVTNNVSTGLSYLVGPGCHFVNNF
jgi:hypothetical protein